MMMMDDDDDDLLGNNTNIFTIYCENHIKDTPCRQNEKIVNAKAGDTYSNWCTLKD
jgi:hypothetical protein